MRSIGSLMLLSAILLASTEALCAGEQLARFTPWMNDLEKRFAAKADPAEETEALLYGRARGDAFHLQGLGRLYQKLDPEFKHIRKDFKAIEDGIGMMDKWHSLVKKAIAENADPTVIASLKAKREAAKQEFAAYLVKKEWIGVPAGQTPRLARIREFLQNYQWPTAEADRDYVLGVLVDHINELDQTVFDFSILEEGNSLHEYRRSLRWLLMEMRALNGLVVFNPDPQYCSAPAFKSFLTKPGAFDSRYVSLPPSEIEKKPCMISRCLFVAINDAVTVLGVIKDGAEAYSNIKNNGIDKTLPDVQAAAEKIYAANQEGGLLRALANEISACR